MTELIAARGTVTKGLHRSGFGCDPPCTTAASWCSALMLQMPTTLSVPSGDSYYALGTLSAGFLW